MAAGTFSFEKLTDTRRRIHRVVDFIDEHLDEQMRLAELADIACISRFHFQRVYGRLVGRSPAETIRRLRLLRARDRIVLDGISPEAAAQEAGFRSVTVFARAYRHEFDRNLSEIRPSWQQLPKPRPLHQFTIVERRSQAVAGLHYEGERAAMDPLTIDTQAYARHMSGEENAKAVAIYHDDFLTPYDQNFRCDLCFPSLTSELPGSRAGFKPLVVPGGFYACVEQRGVLLDLEPYWRQFADSALPQFGWRLRPGPTLRWFVSDRAITPPSQRLAYLYIPVERADD